MRDIAALLEKVLEKEEDATRRHKCTQNDPKADFREECVGFFLPEIQAWEEMGWTDGWIAHSRINLLVLGCCCCRSSYPGEGVQAQQPNLFHSCLALLERWIGNGQESSESDSV